MFNCGQMKYKSDSKEKNKNIFYFYVDETKKLVYII